MNGNAAGAWVRPISHRPDHSLTFAEMAYQDSSQPALLDIVRVPLLRQCPHPYQVENQLIDPEFYWIKVGTLDPQTLPRFSDDAPSLWVNGCSSGTGHNDRVPLERAQQLRSSLLFVEPQELVMRVALAYNRRTLRAVFTYRGEHYNLRLTDPELETRYAHLNYGDYTLNYQRAFLCVSLGEPFEGYAYKLVASITGIV